jgi:excisionase family DNA binding protein
MSVAPPYGTARRMLTLTQVCEWFGITERHVRKLVERDAIPYRKVGHLLRFPEAEIEEWSKPHTNDLTKKQSQEQSQRITRTTYRLPR